MLDFTAVVCYNIIMNRKRQITDVLRNQRKQASRRYYYKLRFMTMQAYTGSDFPVCELCGNTDYQIFHMHHPHGDRAKLMEEAKVSPTDNLSYWKWLKLHKFPKKHKVKVLCKFCHRWWHKLEYHTKTDSLDRLSRRVNYRLRRDAYINTFSVPIWLINKLSDMGYKMCKKEIDLLEEPVEAWNVKKAAVAK